MENTDRVFLSFHPYYPPPLVFPNFPAPVVFPIATWVPNFPPVLPFPLQPLLKEGFEAKRKKTEEEMKPILPEPFFPPAALPPPDRFYNITPMLLPLSPRVDKTITVILEATKDWNARTFVFPRLEDVKNFRLSLSNLDIIKGIAKDTVKENYVDPDIVFATWMKIIKNGGDLVFYNRVHNELNGIRPLGKNFQEGRFFDAQEKAAIDAVSKVCKEEGIPVSNFGAMRKFVVADYVLMALHQIWEKDRSYKKRGGPHIRKHITEHIKKYSCVEQKILHIV
jgi:hypothetical protein